MRLWLYLLARLTEARAQRAIEAGDGRKAMLLRLRAEEIFCQLDGRRP